jgi:hypothetical protein
VTGTAAAAEWSVAPTLNWTADTDSNRDLAPNPVNSQGTVVSGVLALERETEATKLTLNSQVDWHVYDRREYANVFEDNVNAVGTWTGDRTKLDVTAQDGDQSTLTTEATQTGILNSSIHQRMEQANFNVSYSQTERTSFIFNTGYTDSSYYGTADSFLLNLLEGYRNWTSSVSEQFQLTELSSLTATASRVEVLTRLPGNNTTETGGQIAYHRPLSESLSFDVSIGDNRVDSGESGRNATTGSLVLGKSFEAGSLTLDYSRSLSPYGTGEVAQRQQLSLTGTRNLTDQLQLNGSVMRVQNGQLAAPPQLGGQLLPQVLNSDSVTLSLRWACTETLSLTTEVGGTHAQIPVVSNAAVNEWRASVSVAWTPRRLSTSF